MVLATPGNYHGYVHSFYIRRTYGVLEGPTSSFEIEDERPRKAFTLNHTDKALICFYR